jgi:hypothetical protein
MQATTSALSARSCEWPVSHPWGNAKAKPASDCSKRVKVGVPREMDLFRSKSGAGRFPHLRDQVRYA